MATALFAIGWFLIGVGVGVIVGRQIDTIVDHLLK